MEDRDKWLNIPCSWFQVKILLWSRFIWTIETVLHNRAAPKVEEPPNSVGEGVTCWRREYRAKFDKLNILKTENDP